MFKIITIFGTRPEAIKMAPLITELKKRDKFRTYVCVTGQHKEMLDQVLETFNIIPDYNLNIMRLNQTLFDLTLIILEKMQSILISIKPNLVLVHGDTSTTFVTALACYYLQIPVGHVEAGLRTYNKYSPFPEEFNRHATSLISYINFAPTELAAKNLISEGINEKSIHVTGNTVIDALKTTIKENYSHKYLDWLGDCKLILLTVHRRENVGIPMKNAFKAIKRIVDENINYKVIYPIHRNPLIRALADEIFFNDARIKIIDPLDVVDFHNFMARAHFILTDSGGIQEEAPSLGKPVLVLRDSTERPEGVKAGVLKVIGTDEEKIYSEVSLIINDSNEYEKMSKAINPYGDGFASVKIVNIIERIFNEANDETIISKN
jgi:UDP-N-acetylglucosamine 2-epimerase (non-hydrolysing)